MHGTSRTPATATASPAATSQTAASTMPASTMAASTTTSRTLRPLIIDIGVPLGSYYLLHSALGMSVVLSLALSTVVPAVRTIAGVAADRKLNLLAGLMVAVNLAGIGVSLGTGHPRMMIAKDSGISSVIAIAILLSVAARRPLMSAGLRLYMIKGSAERAAAWDRLSAGCPRFRRTEMLFSVIWGITLLAECIARLVGAFALPVPTMVWLSTVFTITAIGIAILVGGIAAQPIEKMIDAEVVG